MMSSEMVRTSTPCSARSSFAFVSSTSSRSAITTTLTPRASDRRRPRSPDAFRSTRDERPRSVARAELHEGDVTQELDEH